MLILWNNHQFTNLGYSTYSNLSLKSTWASTLVRKRCTEWNKWSSDFVREWGVVFVHDCTLLDLWILIVASVSLNITTLCIAVFRIVEVSRAFFSGLHHRTLAKCPRIAPCLWKHPVIVSYMCPLRSASVHFTIRMYADVSSRLLPVLSEFLSSLKSLWYGILCNVSLTVIKLLGSPQPHSTGPWLQQNY